MATYKTKDGIDRVLPGIGTTVNGIITTDFVIENPVFELVSEPQEVIQPSVVTAEPIVNSEQIANKENA